MNPHIHTFKTRGKQPWQAVCAIRLEICHAERLEAKELEAAVLAWLARQMDFINALYTPDGGRTFALRFITRPRAEMFSAGCVDIALLGKTCGITKAAATDAARALCGEVTALLSGAMPEYQWAVVTERAAFEALWTPFSLETAHICELRRREELVSLETLRSRPSLGRGRTDTVLSPTEMKTATYFVHQFLPRPTTLARFLRTLLLHAEPLMFQVTLRPTRLEAAEKAALHELIAHTEKAVAHEGKGSALVEPRVHQNRARALCGGFLELSLRLEDAPYLLQAMLASPAPLPSTIVEAAGIEITHPVWNRLSKAGEIGETAVLQGGGYDTVHPTAAEQAAARANAAQLDFTPWGASFAPASLRRLRQLVDAGEAAAAFRFPLATLDGLMGIEVRATRYRPLPREMAALATSPAAQRLAIGENLSLGQRQPVFLDENARRQHCYVVGQTGTGKTSLLRTMILHDIAAGRGLAVIDPHGDLYHDLIAHIPRERWDDVVLLDPTDMEHPVGLNLLECAGDEDRHFVVREMRSITERLLVDQYGPNMAHEYAGPVFYQHLQMNLLLVMSDLANPGTLIEFYELYQHKDFWKRWLPLQWQDQILGRWVHNNLPGIDYTRRNSEHMTWGEYLSCKFDDFIFDPKLRMIFGQKRSSFDVRRIMDEGKILLVNLAKGTLAEANARFLGMILMAKIQAAAMARVSVPSAQRKPFYLYVDEFQSLTTVNFISMLSEARKFGLGLVLANQFFSQIHDERIMRSIVGNVGTTISFRLGREDAELLEPQFLTAFDRHDLANLPNWNACVKTTIGGQVTPPFTLQTLRPTGASDPSAAAEIIARSRARYGHRRADVEEELRQSLGPTRVPLTRPSASSGNEAGKSSAAGLGAQLDDDARQKLTGLLRTKLSAEPDAVEKLLALHQALEMKANNASRSKK